MKTLLLASTLLTTLTASAMATCQRTDVPGFGIFNGVIYGFDQQPFVPKGVNILYGGQPSVTEILGRFPGANFIRLAVYHYDQDQTFVAYVNSLTTAGLVVLIEDHNNNSGNAGGSRGAIFSGSALSTELAWDSAIGKLFLDNPLVWHASNNEPSMNVVAGNGDYDGSALSRWQFAEYQAFRATGNNAPFFFELNVFGGGQTGTAIGYDASIYAQTNNTGWDRHVYAGGASVAQVASDLATSVAQAQQIKSAGNQTMPVAIFETGDSMMGQSQDPAWRGTLSTVFNSGAGWAAWGWGVGPGDNLMAGGAYTQTVAAALAGSAQPVASGVASCATADTTTANAIVVADGGQPPPLTPSQQDVAQVEAMRQQVQALGVQEQVLQAQSAEIDAQIAALQARPDPGPVLQPVGAR
jgi:hypothetical protein